MILPREVPGLAAETKVWVDDPSSPAPGADADDSGSSWEADNPGQELEFSEDGLDFSNE